MAKDKIRDRFRNFLKQSPETPADESEATTPRADRVLPEVQPQPQVDGLRSPTTTGPRLIPPEEIPEGRPLIEEFQFLLKQLGGKLPSKGPLPQEERPGASIRQDFTVSGKTLLRRDESRRRIVFQKLTEAGYSVDEITGALAFEQAIKPPSRALRTAGTIGAAIVASKLIPGPADDFLIARALLRGGTKAALVGIGGVAGEAAQIAIDPDREFNEAELKKLAGVFVEETALEAGTLGMASVAGKFFGGVKTLPGVTEISESLAKEGQRLGIKGSTRLPAAAMSENAFVDTIQGIGENSLLGSNAMLQFKNGVIKSAESIVDSMSNTIAIGSATRSSDEMASLLLDATKRRGQAHRVVASRLYSVVDDFTSGATVDLSPARTIGADILQTAEKSGDLGLTSKASEVIESVSQGAKWRPVRVGERKFVVNAGPGRTIVGPAKVIVAERELDLARKMGRGTLTVEDSGEILAEFRREINALPIGEAGPNIVSFETAQDIRSKLLGIKRTSASKFTPDPETLRITTSLIESVDAAMVKAAREAGPDAEKIFRRANKFFKAGKDRFENKTIKTLVRQLGDPALSKPDAADVIFRSRENINRVRKAVGPELFQKAKGSWIENIVRTSMQADPSDVSGIGDAVGTRMLHKFNGIGQDALNAAFSPVEQKRIRDSMRGLALIQERTGGQSGALRFVQGAALAGIVTGPFVENEGLGAGVTMASGMLLLGPAVLGKLLTKPTFIKLLSEGFKAPKGTQQSVALTARLIRNVLETRKEINDEREKARVQTERRARSRQVPAPPARTLGGSGGRGF